MQIKDFKIAGSQLPDKSLLFWSCVVFQATKLKLVGNNLGLKAILTVTIYQIRPQQLKPY